MCECIWVPLCACVCEIRHLLLSAVGRLRPECIPNVASVLKSVRCCQTHACRFIGVALLAVCESESNGCPS